MKVRTSVLRGFALLALSSLTFAACDESTQQPPPPQITVAVTPASAQVQVGGTTSLVAVVSGAANPAVTWRSSNTAIATVDANGTVTGVAAGSAGIIAISQADTTARAAASVTVTAAPPPPPVTLTLVPEAAPVQVGDSLQLVGVVGGPAGVSQNVVYRMLSGSQFATVSASGWVRGIAPGTAVVRAHPAADSTVVRTATITVQPGPVEPGVTLSITPTTATIGVEDSTRFIANVQGSTNTAVTWISQDPAIVRVNAQGYAVGVAPGTAVITARSVADTTQSVNATVIVTAAPPPPPPPSISIASITRGLLGQPINPTNTFGQIDAVVNVSAVPQNNVRSVALLIEPAAGGDEVEVCRQDFTPALGTTQSVATINCPINTAATQENGVPFFLNGNYRIRAVAFDAVGGLNGGGEAIADALFCPQGQQQACVVTFNNTNFFAVTWEVDGVTSDAPAIGAVDNLLWHEGDVTVTVRPALFTGGSLQSINQVCLQIPGGSSASPAVPVAPLLGPSVASGVSCRNISASTNNAWSTTYPKSATLANGGVANVSNNNISVSIAGTQLLVGGQQATINQQVGPTPPPLRLDNVGPRYRTDNFATLIGATDQYVGIDFVFSTSAATAAGASVWSLIDPQPGVGGPTVTFHAAPSSEAGVDNLTNNTAITENYPAITRADELQSQLQNNYYVLVVRAEDILGNVTITRVSTFGVDLARPTNVFVAAPSVADQAINPTGFYRIRVTDEFSGVDEMTTLQVRVAHWFNVGATDTRRCLTNFVGPTWSANATTPISTCGWVSYPLTAVGGQVYEADVPVIDDGDGFYQYEIRTVDRAGNVSATTHAFSYYQDDLAPAGSLLTTLNLINLGGTAIPADSIRGNTEAAVTGTVRDNVEVSAYDVRLWYNNPGFLPDNRIPFVAPMAVGTYGLPLTESQNVTRSTPLVVIRDAANFNSIATPFAASLGVWDMAENFGFGSNIVFDTPELPRIIPQITSATAPAFGLNVNPVAINRTGAAPTSTLVSATFTLQDLSIQAPIRAVYFYYMNEAVAGSEHAVLLTSMPQPTRVLTGTQSRTFWWEYTLQGADINVDTSVAFPQVVDLFAIFVDANNNGYYVPVTLTVNN